MEPGNLVRMKRQSIAYPKGAIGLIMVKQEPSHARDFDIYEVQLLSAWPSYRAGGDSRIIRALEQDMEVYETG